jgi:hypothetical protein
MYWQLKNDVQGTIISNTVTPLMALYLPKSTVGVVVNYPVIFTYVDTISGWSTPQAIATSLGVPGFAPTNIYNYVSFTYWLSTGCTSVGLLWNNPTYFLGTTSQFGSTNDMIQKSLKQKFNNAGTKILISAFGPVQLPTSGGLDPIATAISLASFVQSNNLDGVDINYQDDPALLIGTAEAWLVSFTTKLRQLLPTYIIVHTVKASYFKKENYKNGGYTTVNSQVGNSINFYNVIYYNQYTSAYATYNDLFVNSSGAYTGTSVEEIVARGVPSNKIVVGKPCTTGDASNTGYVDSNSLGQWLTQAYNNYKWYAGIAFWQYSSDTQGSIINNAVVGLKQLCSTNKNCI